MGNSGKVVHIGNLSRIIQIRNDVYFREGALIERQQCNCGLIELNGSTAIIDYPAQSPDEEIIDEAELIIGKPVKYLIFTHGHLDHVSGLCTLHRKDISVIYRDVCVEKLRFEKYPIPTAYREICHDEEITLDGVLFHFIIPSGTAHSPWDMLVGLPGYDILFTGDLVATPKDLWMHASDITGWRQTVDKLLHSNWKWIARGHGSFTGAECLSELAVYLQLLNEAKDHLKQFPESITPENTGMGTTNISGAMRTILDQLLFYSDMSNILRQIEQLRVRTKEGF